MKSDTKTTLTIIAVIYISMFALATAQTITNNYINEPTKTITGTLKLIKYTQTGFGDVTHTHLTISENGTEKPETYTIKGYYNLQIENNYTISFRPSDNSITELKPT